VLTSDGVKEIHRVSLQTQLADEGGVPHPGLERAPKDLPPAKPGTIIRYHDTSGQIVVLTADG
jgi:hypothetical protein